MKEKAEKILLKAKECEKQEAFWEAGQMYHDALLEFNNLSDCKKEKAFCKRKIREMNLKKSKDFKHFSCNHSLTKEDLDRINEIVDSFFEKKDINYTLQRTGLSAYLVPNYAQVKESAKKSMPISFQIANIASQSENGDFIKDGNNPDAIWLSEIYKIQQNFICNFYLADIFKKAMENDLCIQNLSDYFKSKKLFTEDFTKVLDAGLERFFEEDYISALHILVPKFEKVFMDLTGVLGEADAIASRSQKGEKELLWTQDRILGEDFLRNEEVRKIWGEDFCEQINFVFFSSLGYKLRHKIAHGYSTIEDFSFQNTILVIYFYLVIYARVNKKTN